MKKLYLYIRNSNLIDRVIKVGFLGTRGVPASYSGFETFYDKLASGLSQKFEILVFNRWNYIRYPFKSYKGAQVISLYSIPQKHLDTISHTFISALYCILNWKPDIALICGVGNSILLPIFKVSRIKTVINVDGADWKRKKWGKFSSWYLRVSEALASRWADIIVADAIDVKKYYQVNYKVPEEKIVYIPYGGITKEDIEKSEMFGNTKEFLEGLGLEPYKYFLFVGRLVPENSPHMLITAFKRARVKNETLKKFKVALVGDAPYSEDYKSFLKKIAKDDPSVVFTGYLFSASYINISLNAFAFVFCAEVGGTHPVLVEQMSLGSLILCRDTSSNREVLGDSGLFFRTEEEVADLLCKTVESDFSELKIKARSRAEELFSWDKISKEYEELFLRLAG